VGENNTTVETGSETENLITQEQSNLLTTEFPHVYDWMSTQPYMTTKTLGIYCGKSKKICSEEA